MGKKELDIAMNQEIEGKRIKVLPILAGKCSIPGFLKGKLYADMSTSIKFKKSLPLLLSRLDIPHTLILDTVKNKTNANDVSKNIHKIIDGLESNDLAFQYDVLKSLNSYHHKEAIKHPHIRDLLLDKLNANTPRHIRLEAVRAIGFLEDPNFADLVMPLVYDPDETVAARAIETLADLKAEQKGPLLLSLLPERETPQRQRAILHFLERISFPDEADAISAVASVLHYQEECSLGSNCKNNLQSMERLTRHNSRSFVVSAQYRICRSTHGYSRRTQGNRRYLDTTK